MENVTTGSLIKDLAGTCRMVEGLITVYHFETVSTKDIPYGKQYNLTYQGQPTRVNAYFGKDGYKFVVQGKENEATLRARQIFHNETPVTEMIEEKVAASAGRTCDCPPWEDCTCSTQGNKAPLTLCFTGHRPKYFPDWDWNNPWTNPAAKRMIDYGTRDLQKIMEIYQIDRAWSGGALGWDQIAFWIVYKMKLAGVKIENTLAIPYAQQAKSWRSKELVDRWHQMLKLADKRIYTDTVDGYADGPINVHTNMKLDLRNHYMVDNSDIVYAMWNGSAGGTQNCIRFAANRGKTIYVTNPETGEFYRYQ